MKFSKDSCNIPDELIIAHQEGKVVFFCGAGVSIGAGLPDFWQLAESVVSDLRVSQNSEAKKFFDTSKSFKEQHPSLTSITTADQLFSFLELEFLSEDIECSVLKALKPKESADTSNHKIILDLARTSSGITQLVTTNFDRCFESFEDSPNQCWIAPKLPNLDRGDVLDGIVYLHGRANENYTTSDGHEVVLNTADFGNAYISNGWATQLFKQILERFIVVFVGYSADDPPINFLLRALKKYRGGLNEIYAFEHGNPQEVQERWNHKGVKAIPFPQGDYQCLWRTLDAWSEFHKNTSSWYSELFNRASKGPRQLERYERDQVAFLIKTIDGAKRLLNSEPPLPAEWLCVFDRNRRYADQHELLMDENPVPPSPQSLYGLESDPPVQVMRNDAFAHNSISIPRNAWHGLAFSLEEINALPAYQRHSIPDVFSGNYQLSERLQIIGSWIAKSYAQASCLWWAHLQKQPLHESIVRRIEHSLNYGKDSADLNIRDGWRKVIAVWRDSRLREREDWYLFKLKVDRDGWSATDIQGFSDLLRPRLTLGETRCSEIAPKDSDGFKIRLRIRFFKQHMDIPMPDNILAEIASTFRNNIDYAFTLSRINNIYLNDYIDPIGCDQSDRVVGGHDLNFLIDNYIRVLSRLKIYRPEFYLKEFASLQVNNSAICQVKIFLSYDIDFVSDQLFEFLINTEIPVDIFWRESVLFSLLGAVKNRWSALSFSAKKYFSNRIANGPVRPNNISDDDWNYRHGYNVLNAIQWMENNGCKLVGVNKNIKSSLVRYVPDWAPSSMSKYPFHRRVAGVIRSNTDWNVLENKSSAEILKFLESFSKRDHLSLTENNPFTGLSRDKPLKALRTLLISRNYFKFSDELWREFLCHMIRKNDPPKLSAIIARKICDFSSEEIELVEHYVFSWYSKTSGAIFSYSEKLHRILTDKLYIFLLNKESPDCPSNTDLLNHAINVPIGFFVQAVIHCPVKHNGFLDLHQLDMLASLLDKGGVDGCLTLVLCASQISWFYSRNPSWTKTNLLNRSFGEKQLALAFWEGFLWLSHDISSDLFDEVKGSMLKASLDDSGDFEKLTHKLSDMLVIGWVQNFLEKSLSSISHEELFEFLVSCSEDMRVSFLSNLRFRMESDQSDVDWNLALSKLFSGIWPKQKAIKTTAINSELCSLLFSMNSDFPYYFDLIFPYFYGRINNSIELPFCNEDSSKESALIKYSDLILKLLVKVLPYDSSDWPYRVEEYVLFISEVKGKKSWSEHLIELIGRINRR